MTPNPVFTLDDFYPIYVHQNDGWYWYDKSFIQLPDAFISYGPFKIEAMARKDSMAYLKRWAGALDCDMPEAFR